VAGRLPYTSATLYKKPCAVRCGNRPRRRARVGEGSSTTTGTVLIEVALPALSFRGAVFTSMWISFGCHVAFTLGVPTRAILPAYTSRTALPTKRRAVRSSNHLVTKRA
jgi:uncharacterized membrane protein